MTYVLSLRLAGTVHIASIVYRRIVGWAPLLIGGIFLWASIPKLLHPYAFLSTVYSYEMTGAKLGLLVAVVLPWLEAVIAGCLILGVCRIGATATVILMLVVFLYAQFSAIHRGMSISCGCWGSDSSPINYMSLVWTSLLLLACMGVLTNLVAGVTVYRGDERGRK